MLAIPYLTRNGPKAIRFRRLDGGKPKYAQHTGSLTRLFNTAAYFTADDTIGIAEGEIDAVVATERLHIPTIGVPGCEMWVSKRAIWPTIFKNFQTVYVFTDGDPVNEQTGVRPGEELGRAVQESLGFRAKIIACPLGEDVSSMVTSGRSQELLDKMGDDPEDGDEDLEGTV